MKIFLVALLTTSLTMSIAILLLFLLNKLTANKVSASFRYYMWLIILVGLLIPFRPSLPISFEIAQTPLSFISADSTYVKHSEIGTQQVTTFESAAIPDTGSTTSTVGNPLVSRSVILFGIWMCGTLTIMAFHFWSYIKFISSIQRWGVELEHEQALSVLKVVQDDMRLNDKQIKVKICELISSPMLIGFRRPEILLPERPILHDELEYIFRHELVHYKRKDLWVNLIVLLALALHWFNPIVYLMTKIIRTDCEAACDEAVIAGSNKDKRIRYGETIIGFSGGKKALTPILSTYFFGGSTNMKKRLFSIMDTSQKRKGVSVVCAISVILAILMLDSVFAATSTSRSPEQYIDQSRAKSIALEHAGISEANAVFIKTHFDYDDGRIVYDVKFYSGNTEYEYEIDAISGDILEYDRDIEYYSISANSSAPTDSSQYIDIDKAKSIALEHSGIPSSEAAFTKARLDNDDWHIVYDIKFYSGNTEYDYEIDAISGDILEYDREIKYYTKQNDSVAKTASKKSSKKSSNKSAIIATEQFIGEQAAKSTALSAAGLSESQVSRIKVKLEREDGIIIYEVEFDNGPIEYEYEIDAINGTILKTDIEYDD